MERVVDVSDNQGVIDWLKVGSTGITFAVLRSVRRSGKADYQFAANVKGCIACDIGFDVYKYSYALTKAQAITEATQVVTLLRQHGCGGEVTVWWDVEDKILLEVSRNELTACIKAARQVIEAAGYTFGIYCNWYWYSRVINVDTFDCPFWIARYGANDGKPHIKPILKKQHKLWGWQYTSAGRVNGIKGYVDLSELYV